jgi:FKBP-type peptidyl-prolyl cis-trans isomerase SlyD
MNEVITVADDVAVSFEYTLSLDDEQVIDQADTDDPLEFIQGYRQIIPGLESALYGMAVGDEKDVVVTPADGYGEHKQDDVVEVAKDNFPSSIELAEGKPLNVRDAQSGESFTAYVTELRPDTAILDFNHPLAGETLYFHVKIIGLRQATSDEIVHRHVHESEDDE